MKWLNGILIIIIFLILLPSIITKVFSPGSDLPENPSVSENTNEIIIIPEKEDIYISMYDVQKREIVKLLLDDYLMGVVAGEMPATFDSEALKAQAVAARTLSIYKMLSFGGRGCNKKEGADVCSSFAHCQEWISEETRQKNWGEYYTANFNKIKQAVLETRGEIMKYDGRPIEVLFHSTSNGKTEDAGEVFSNSLPYYTVVESVGEEDAPKFQGSVTYTKQKFVDIFNNHYKSSLNTKNLSKQVKINGYTESGRVSDITVGGVKLQATDFRFLYGLNSTDFTIRFDDNSVIINTKGFGHGVGMSQVGADQMAKRGYYYKEILYHYYQGVDIVGY